MSERGWSGGFWEFLLQKVRPVNGSDSSLKAALNAGIIRQLSTAGVTGFQSGELARLLNAEARERFRNPAAHTRYVGLETARECKLYVENVLEKLVEYTRSDGQADPTVH